MSTLVFSFVVLVAGSGWAHWAAWHRPTEPRLFPDGPLRAACDGDHACMEERREDVERTARQIIGIVHEERPEWPLQAKLLFVAWAARESRFRDEPRGHSDAGTSGGMFQVKRRGALARSFQRRNGRWPDTLDREESLRLLLSAFEVSLRNAGRICGAHGWDRFVIAIRRLGKGPRVNGRERCERTSVVARWAERWAAEEGVKWLCLLQDESARCSVGTETARNP